MSLDPGSVLSRLRRPEYTGENRCTPCTVVNVVVAAVVAGSLAAVSVPAGALALLASLSLVYLRGYLVPGTPTLTARYLPDPVLRRFGKDPVAGGVADAGDAHLVGSGGGDDDGGGGGFDPEPVLLEVGVVEPTADGRDLRLADGFAAEWRAAIDRVRGAADYRDRVGRLLGRETGWLVVDRRVDGCVVRDDSGAVARWESEAALLADVAAAGLLRERYPGWADADLPARGTLLSGLRVFLESCPDCGGTLAFSEGTVDSCCRSAEVVRLACPDCEATVLEVEVDGA